MTRIGVLIVAMLLPISGTTATSARQTAEMKSAREWNGFVMSAIRSKMKPETSPEVEALTAYQFRVMLHDEQFARRLRLTEAI